MTAVVPGGETKVQVEDDHYLHPGPIAARPLHRANQVVSLLLLRPDVVPGGLGAVGCTRNASRVDRPAHLGRPHLLAPITIGSHLVVLQLGTAEGEIVAGAWVFLWGVVEAVGMSAKYVEDAARHPSRVLVHPTNVENIVQMAVANAPIYAPERLALYASIVLLRSVGSILGDGGYGTSHDLDRATYRPHAAAPGLDQLHILAGIGAEIAPVVVQVRLVPELEGCWWLAQIVDQVISQGLHEGSEGSHVARWATAGTASHPRPGRGIHHPDDNVQPGCAVHDVVSIAPVISAIGGVGNLPGEGVFSPLRPHVGGHAVVLNKGHGEAEAIGVEGRLGGSRCAASRQGQQHS